MKTILKKIQRYGLTLLIILAFSQSYAQIRQQENTMWCWAACVQSVLAQANVHQSQTEIVARLTGSPQNRPAHVREVVQLLQSYQFRAWEVGYPASADQLFSTLKGGWKLIALVNPSNNPNVGHFIILQGLASWQGQGSGMILVSDPATGQTYQQSPQQLYSAWKWNYSVVVGTPVLAAY
uniref:Papain-like cysteine protease family protein n=1 Tax=Roseihalotalea indica TaxID=2867963 RepID=A0AA49JK34_9BACT|nr:papain-like cysteine protease family protein [Tunicatimonas sp. TK19036]